MYKANTLIREYITNVWNRELGPLNKDPVKFEIITELGSRREVPIPLDPFLATLDHIIVNSMAAISDLDCHGEEIMELWEPDTPGKIILRTYNLDDKTRFEIEDNGRGIDPRKISEELKNYQYAEHLKDVNTDYGLINAIYSHGLSTKRTFGGKGLSDTKLTISIYGGRIYTAGTTYSKSGSVVPSSKRDLAKIGEHHGKTTGTVIRIEFPSKLPSKK